MPVSLFSALPLTISTFRCYCCFVSPSRPHPPRRSTARFHPGSNARTRPPRCVPTAVDGGAVGNNGVGIQKREAKRKTNRDLSTYSRMLQQSMLIPCPKLQRGEREEDQLIINPLKQPGRRRSCGASFVRISSRLIMVERGGMCHTFITALVIVKRDLWRSTLVTGIPLLVGRCSL